MGQMIQALKERMNKYILIILATTILLGVMGWLLPVGKEESSYTVEASLTLGNYNNPELNNPKRVNILLTTAPFFYEEHLADLWEEKYDEISTKLNVTAGTDNMITLSYSDHSKESTAKVLNEIISAFMARDQARFQQKQKIIQESIESLNNEKVGPDAKVDQQRFLYELKTALYEIKHAKLIKKADENAIKTENRAFNSKERVVLGVLLGVTLGFIWIVIPVIFRERSN
jgi:teichuronic acid biosynthesis protein TuaF